MQLTKIGITYSRKLNLGDYNSAEIAINLWTQLDPWDQPEEVVRALWEMAKNNVKAQIVPLKVKDEKILAEISELFLGLPIQNMTEDEMIRRMTQTMDPNCSTNPSVSSQETNQEKES